MTHEEQKQYLDIAKIVLTVATIILALVFVSSAHATYKPEYDKAPFAVQQWFRNAETPEKARSNGYTPYKKCCDSADRFVTKFEQSNVGEWKFYTDPSCVVKGCPIAPIPDVIVHDDEIHATKPDGKGEMVIDEEADKLPEFDEMRRQGVLFIYNGKPVCFWPPQGGG